MSIVVISINKIDFAQFSQVCDTYNKHHAPTIKICSIYIMCNYITADTLHGIDQNTQESRLTGNGG